MKKKEVIMSGHDGYFVVYDHLEKLCYSCQCSILHSAVSADG